MNTGIKYLVFIVLLVGNTIAGISQTQIDSLVSRLETNLSDTNLIITLLELSVELRLRDPAKALLYSEQALRESEKIGYQKGIADSYNYMGVVYNNRGDYKNATDCFAMSAPIYEEINDLKGLASLYNSIGRLWTTQENWEQALKYFRQSQNISKELNQKEGIASTYLNIGTALDLLGYHDSAMINWNIAIKSYEEIGKENLLSAAYLNLGGYYEWTGEYDQALDFYNKSLEISKRANNKIRISDAFSSFGYLYKEKGDYQLAITYYDSALTIANELESYELLNGVTEQLIHLYTLTSKFEEAVRFYELNRQYEDSLGLKSTAEELIRFEWNRRLEQEQKLYDQELSRMVLIRNFTWIALGLILILVFFIYRNYRANQKAKQILEEVDQLKSRMFSNISHEFRTPLTLILSPLEEMLSEESKMSFSRKTLSMMHRNASQLLSLVNQMLDLSKMDAGKLKLELKENDLISNLKFIISSFISMAEHKKINYKHHLSHEAWVTYYDSDKIEKILNNLLSNAIKYTPKKGIVTVHILIQENEKSSLPATERKGEEYLVLRINDTGPGIPDDQQDKIFTRFHRIESGMSEESPGTGIGLALVKELVELLHGRISVESGQGRGTTFTVNIPLDTGHLDEYEYSIADKGKEEKLPADAVDEHEKEVIEIIEEPAQEELDDSTDEGVPVLLIVEDNPDIRSHIHDYIKDEYQVLEEEDGVRGLETALERIPDLIITDLMMPEMDGVELCERLKTNELTSHIPVIMLTAKADVSSKIEGLETGADDYITKPFNMKELSVRISNLIKTRKELREKFSKGISLEPKEVAVTSYDEKFLKRALDIVEERIQDGDFDVATFGNEIGMSRMQLFRKIKAMTDQSPTEFIRTIRLKRAAQLIRGNFGNLAEITYEVGFNHPSYFAKSFKELFGVSPSEYASNPPMN